MKMYEVVMSTTITVEAENESDAMVQADQYVVDQEVWFDIQSVTEVKD